MGDKGGDARYPAPMTTPLLTAIGARVRELREVAGLTQTEFADAAGLNPKYLSRMELGRQNVTAVSLGRVALGFGLTMSTLLDGIAVDAAILEPKPRANARARAAPVEPD